MQPNFFKFGHFLQSRCEEAVRLLELNIISSAGLFAIAGSSVRENVLDYMSDQDIPYLRMHAMEHPDDEFVALVARARKESKILLIEHAECLGDDKAVIRRDVICDHLRRRDVRILLVGGDRIPENFRDVWNNVGLISVMGANTR